MFSVIVNKEDLKTGMDEITNRLQYWLKLSKIPLTQKLLAVACPAIEANLRSAKNLPIHSGKKAFYDTETEDAYWNRPANRKGYLGSKYQNNYQRSEHLLDCWKVAPVQLSVGGNAIRISNNKEVKGKNTYYNLFSLLWEGTNYFLAPVNLTRAEAATAVAEGFHQAKEFVPASFIRNRKKNPIWHGHVSTLPSIRPLTADEMQQNRDLKRKQFEAAIQNNPYVNRRQLAKQIFYVKPERFLKRERSKHWYFEQTEEDIKNNAKKKVASAYARQPYYAGINKASGEAVKPANWGKAQRMSFYCRYAGKFYYNQYMRRGIEKPMVREFHDYVADCVYKGFYDALGMVFSSGNSTPLMRQVFKDIDMK